MLFVLYGILLIGGMYLLGLSFNLAAFQSVAFILGILVISAAVAIPITAGISEHRN